jgi:Raf kinase inhibitor-like YbhB/YbcL family protein
MSEKIRGRGSLPWFWMLASLHGMAGRSFMNGTVGRGLWSVTAGAAACLGLLVGPGCWRGESVPADDPSRLTITLRSPAFSDGGMIPGTYTCDGSDRSPPLEWSGVPDPARSLTLICDDPDAPTGTWSHWVLFNLPPQVKALGEGIPAEETPAVAAEGAKGAGADAPTTRQGRNDFRKTGYGGPCPPSGTHRYFFRLYALDTRLELTSSATRADVLKAIQGHILAEGRLVGKYTRAK